MAATLYEIQVRRKIFSKIGMKDGESAVKNVLNVEYHQILSFAKRLDFVSRSGEKNGHLLDELRRDMEVHVHSFKLPHAQCSKLLRIVENPRLVFPNVD